jgi:hypothetical protein
MFIPQVFWGQCLVLIQKAQTNMGRLVKQVTFVGFFVCACYRTVQSNTKSSESHSEHSVVGLVWYKHQNGTPVVFSDILNRSQ